MLAFLKANGVDAIPKYIKDGSLSGCWRLYNPDIKWNETLRQKLIALGFLGFDFKEIGKYAGNGGMFSVFVRGHKEFLVPSWTVSATHPLFHHEAKYGLTTEDAQVENKALVQLGYAVQITPEA